MRSARSLPFQLQPRTLSGAICLALALIGGTASPSVLAAPPAATAAPSISAGPLEQALNTFAEHAGITLSYSPDVVRGLNSPGLAGGGPLEEGLATLLGGSGLAAHKTPSGYVVLPSKTDARLELAPVSIYATAGQNAFAPVEPRWLQAARSSSNQPRKRL